MKKTLKPEFRPKRLIPAHRDGKKHVPGEKAKLLLVLPFVVAVAIGSYLLTEKPPSSALDAKTEFVKLVGELRDPDQTADLPPLRKEKALRPTGLRTEQEEKTAAMASAAKLAQVHTANVQRTREEERRRTSDERKVTTRTSDRDTDALQRERQRMLQSQSQMLRTSTEVESRHRVAEDLARQKQQEREAQALHDLELRRRRTKELEAQKNQLRSPAYFNPLNPKPGMYLKIMRLAPMVHPSNSEYGDFRGALTKCNISGHDVHWINDQGGILTHVQIHEVLEGTKRTARELIRANGSVVVVVFERGYEVYQKDGRLIERKELSTN